MKPRQLVFAFIILASLSFFAVAQENSGQTQAPPRQEQAAPTQAGQTPSQEVNRGSSTVHSMQEQLAETSNEAAGEEENAQFKYAPSVRWIGKHLGVGVVASYWILFTLNFLIVAGLIGWAWKKNVPAMFRSRTQNIRKSLDEAQHASEDATRRLTEIEKRLGRLDAEISEMRASAEKESAAEEARIKAASEEDRRRVIESAEAEIEAAARVARRELKAYAATLAVNLAEKKIHVDPQTDEALVNSFVRELGGNGTGRNGR